MKSIDMKNLFVTLLMLLAVLSASAQSHAVRVGSGTTTTTKRVNPSKEVNAMNGILAKAKKYGASWSVDQWKEQFKNVLIATKPMFLTMAEINTKMEAAGDDAVKMAEIMKEVETLEKRYGELDKQMNEFNDIAEGTENGRIVLEDEDWGTKVMEELGIPDLDN